MHQAVQILYKGQNNVRLMADEIGVGLEAMKAELDEYVKATPIDEDIWRGDVEASWPWA